MNSNITVSDVSANSSEFNIWLPEYDDMALNLVIADLYNRGNFLNFMTWFNMFFG